jgi:uncharacterized protein with HEPN domain
VSKISLETLLSAHDNRSYWRMIKDMRNFLIHQYWGVSIEIVYDVATQNIPKLENYIDNILEKI